MTSPTLSAPTAAAACWCGSPTLEPFSDDYGICPVCGSLVLRAMRGEEISRVEDDERDFYGKNYYLRHVQEDLGLPDLVSRARADLPERCLHWLRTFLRFSPGPGARVLELGCGHGGFVAMLRWAGFDAEGLELSPWLVARVREWFNVPVLTGPLEAQDLPEGSFDAVVLMDVLEHLPDPAGTIARAAHLLRPGGFLLVQTPAFPTGFPDENALRAAGHPFAEMLLPQEHLHLFSREATRRLMAKVGLPEVRFEPAIFARYDMFFVASAAPLTERSEADWSALLENPETAPAGRSLLALLDLDTQRREVSDRLARAETDAAGRQTQVAELTALLKESETDRAARQEQVEKLTTQLHASETDRDARRTQVEKIGARLTEAETDRAARQEQVEELTTQLHASETDRDARRAQVEELTKLLRESETDRDARGAQVKELTDLFQAAQTDRAARGEQVEELTSLLRESETDRAARGSQIEQLTTWLKESEADRNARGEHITHLTALYEATQAGHPAPAARG